MNRKFFVAVLSCLLAFTMVFGLAACGNKEKNNPDPIDGDNPTPPPPAPPVAVTRYAEDARTNAFGYYTADGSKEKEFNDMYKAIAYCVEEGDNGDYVAKLSGNDSDVKLFVLTEDYKGQGLTDQYFYYENGTSLDRYTPWKDGYHADLGSVSKKDLVLYKTKNGLDTYRHGYELVSIAGKGGALANWNVYPFYDANVQVDLVPYSGVTKEEYTIKLTEAKIYPTYEGYQKTYAHIGFISPDENIVAHYGLACDVNTGNWYYYYGNSQATYDKADEYAGIVYDTSKVVLTSTWNEQGGYYTPDADVVLTAEILTLTEDGDSYIVDRLTANFGENNIFTHDFEQAAMTACANIRFTVGLNIWNTEGMPQYDNGAQFTNVKITSAVATVHQEIADDDSKYGGQVALFNAGTYDLLNSNPASSARYHTVLYNRAVIDYNFDTAGQDIYSISFRLPQNQPAYSTSIRGAKEKIAAIPAKEEYTLDDEETYVKPAREAYDALVKEFQTDFVSAAEVKKLEDAEKLCRNLHYTQAVVAVVNDASELKTIGKDGNSYTSVGALKDDASKIAAVKAKYDALTDDEKAVTPAATVEIITKANAALAALEELDLAEDFDFTSVNAVLSAASTNLWNTYVDEDTFAGVCTMDESAKVAAVLVTATNDAGEGTDGYNFLNETEKQIVSVMDGGIVEWAIGHYKGEYKKIDKIFAIMDGTEDATVTGKTEEGLANLEGAAFEAKLAELVEIFNSFDGTTAWVFKNAAGASIPDGIYWAYKTKLTEHWTTLQTYLEGRYTANGHKFVPVEA